MNKLLLAALFSAGVALLGTSCDEDTLTCLALCDRVGECLQDTTSQAACNTACGADDSGAYLDCLETCDDNFGDQCNLFTPCVAACAAL